MSVSHTEDFKRDNGLPITVEYEIEGSYSPTTYSPLNGADGGDSPTFMIIDAWPNDGLTGWLAERAMGIPAVGAKLSPSGYVLLNALRLPFRLLLRFDIWFRCSLTDAERERIEQEIAEDYEPDYEDESDYDHD